MLKIIHYILDRLFVVAGAFIGSQVPAFIQQYSQRLAGHVDELGRTIATLQKAAEHSNKNLDQYIGKFITSSDPDFSKQGEIMQSIVFRWQEITTSYQHLTGSNVWSRPFVFFSEWQPDIVKATLKSFQPSLALSVEGLCYTVAGLFAGYLFYHLIVRLFSALYRGLTPFRSPYLGN